ncbi:MAG: hemerythrin domain-containing protein [Steroidobacteraceae bacterium]
MNASVTRIIPDITTMIRMDHSHVLALFHRFKNHTAPNKKRALVRNACLAIEVHAQLEEEIFYPALRTVISGDEVLEKSEREHNEMRLLIRELRELTNGDGAPTDEAFDDKFRALIRIVMHHVADEETRLLPAAERLLSEQLSQLGVAMTKRRLELIKPHAGELAATAARSFPAGAAAGAALITAGAVAVGAMLLYRGRSRGGKARRLHH